MNKTLMYTALALMSAFLLGLVLPVPWWVYAGIIAASLFLFVLGSVHVCSGFYLQVICSGRTDEKAISLTFDDGPDPEMTPELLDVLRQYKVHAAFFCIGSKVAGNPELAARMETEGHLIGNHSYSHHYWFDLFPMKKMKAELEMTRDIIFQVTGKKARLFRPPYGVTNPTLARAVSSLGLTAVGWSLRSRDTVIREEKVLLERIRERIRPGDVILLHDTSRHMASVLKELIEWTSLNQYRIVRLDQLLNIKAYD